VDSNGDEGEVEGFLGSAAGVFGEVVAGGGFELFGAFLNG